MRRIASRARSGPSPARIASGGSDRAGCGGAVGWTSSCPRKEHAEDRIGWPPAARRPRRSGPGLGSHHSRGHLRDGTRLNDIVASLLTMVLPTPPDHDRLSGMTWNRGRPHVLWFLFEHLPVGRYLYAIGSNARAAELVAIDVPRYIVLAFIASSTLTAAAGIHPCCSIARGPGVDRPGVPPPGVHCGAARSDGHPSREGQRGRHGHRRPRPCGGRGRATAVRRPVLRRAAVQRAHAHPGGGARGVCGSPTYAGPRAPCALRSGDAGESTDRGLELPGSHAAPNAAGRCRSVSTTDVRCAPAIETAARDERGTDAPPRSRSHPRAIPRRPGPRE